MTGLPGGGPVHTLFNTHWHPEQTGSNEVVGKAGKTIIAQENTRLWLATDVTWSWNGQRFKRLPKIAQPNKTFYTTGKLELPKERREGVPADSVIQYGYIPDAAHTDGDLYVYFPKQNVLAVGDVVSGRGLARRRLADRRLDRRDRRRPSAVADDGERRHADRAGSRAGARRWQTSRSRPRCTATIYDRLSTAC